MIILEGVLEELHAGKNEAYTVFDLFLLYIVAFKLGFLSYSFGCIGLLQKTGIYTEYLFKTATIPAIPQEDEAGIFFNDPDFILTFRNTNGMMALTEVFNLDTFR